MERELSAFSDGRGHVVNIIIHDESLLKIRVNGKLSFFIEKVQADLLIMGLKLWLDGKINC